MNSQSNGLIVQTVVGVDPAQPRFDGNTGAYLASRDALPAECQEQVLRRVHMYLYNETPSQCLRHEWLGLHILWYETMG